MQGRNYTNVDENLSSNIVDNSEDILKAKSVRKNPLFDLISTKQFSDVIKSSVDITLGELILIILKFVHKNALSLVAFEQLCNLINCIFSFEILPHSGYLIKKLCDPDSDFTFHKTCPDQHYLGKLEELKDSVYCDECEKVIPRARCKTADAFVIINPSQAIAEYISMYADHYTFVTTRRQHEHGIYTDVYDGQYYRKIVDGLPRAQKDSYVFLTLNADGAEPFESSNHVVWPIYCMINELPLEKRFKCLITCGIWFGKSHPDMNVYLFEFVEQINRINENGGIPCTIKGVQKNLKLYVINAVVDCPARAQMNNTVMFNGYYGCDWCLTKGEYYAKAMRYPVDGKIVLREAKTTLKLGKNAEKIGCSIFGVKGLSPLVLLEHFDIIQSFNPDYLHCYLIGAAKHINKFIMRRLTKTQRNLMDEYLERIRVTNKVGKLTRKMSERSYWKAKDWEIYVLYLSIPILVTVELEERYLKHWSILVDSLHVLLSSKIIYEDVLKVDLNLRKFVLHTRDLYGLEALTYNIHQLVHICSSVLNFGPLFCHSTFCFESENGKLMKFVNSAKGVPEQIIRFTNIKRIIDIVKKNVFPVAHVHVKDFFNNLNELRIQKCLRVSEDIYFSGEIDDNKTADLYSRCKVSTLFKAYLRMIKGGCVYKSSYIRNDRSCDSYAILKNGVFIKIILFIYDPETKNKFCICNRINVIEHDFSSFVFICISEQPLKLEDINAIDKICVFVEVQGARFISPCPNLLNY